MSTAVEVRRTLDLTRAPDEQWNEEMFQLVASQVIKRASTKSEQVYCLVVADSLGLNPFIDEIYFLPTKSRDGSGPGIKPYIGRNGLVKKAAEQNAYFEADTIHANDKFRLTRRRDGSVSVAHSYGMEDRGEITGAYAFLHFRNGDKPAFGLAKLEEYLPQFDADWKMGKSPWGNQRSAMIEKCAMIMAGRKRLNLGGVLADGEVARFEQMQQIGPHAPEPPADAGSFDFSEVTDDSELAERLRVACAAAGWSAAKCEMLARGRSDDELREIEATALAQAGRSEQPSATTDAVVDAEHAPASATAAGASEEREAIADAEVVPDIDHEKVRALQARLDDLTDRLNEPEVEERALEELGEEYEQVRRELHAAENPAQTSLL